MNAINFLQQDINTNLASKKAIAQGRFPMPAQQILFE